MRVRGMFGKGKLRPRKAGDITKHEQAFMDHLSREMLAGHSDVAWFKFEHMKLKLADGAWYTPDITALLADGTIVQFEVKPGQKREGQIATVMTDGASLKLKLVVGLHPFRFVLVTAFQKLKRDGGGWSFVQEEL